MSANGETGESISLVHLARVFASQCATPLAPLEAMMLEALDSEALLARTLSGVWFMNVSKESSRAIMKLE